MPSKHIPIPRYHFDEIERVNSCEYVPPQFKHQLTYHNNTSIPAFLCACGRRVRYVVATGPNIGKCRKCANLIEFRRKYQRNHRWRQRVEVLQNEVRTVINESETHLNHVLSMQAIGKGLDIETLARIESQAFNCLSYQLWVFYLGDRLTHALKLSPVHRTKRRRRMTY